MRRPTTRSRTSARRAGASGGLGARRTTQQEEGSEESSGYAQGREVRRLAQTREYEPDAPGRRARGLLTIRRLLAVGDFASGRDSSGTTVSTAREDRRPRHHRGDGLRVRGRRVARATVCSRARRARCNARRTATRTARCTRCAGCAILRPLERRGPEATLRRALPLAFYNSAPARVQALAAAGARRGAPLLLEMRDDSATPAWRRTRARTTRWRCAGARARVAPRGAHVRGDARGVSQPRSLRAGVHVAIGGVREGRAVGEGEGRLRALRPRRARRWTRACTTRCSRRR